jgi:hypothetical protein
VIDQVYDRLSSFFERRFLKNAFLPVLLFFPAVALPILLQGGRLDRLIRALENQATGVKLLFFLGYFALSWFCAAIVASQWRNIIRLYEGYPLSAWPWLDNIGKGWHKAQLRGLQYPREGEGGLDNSYLRHWAYPDISHVLPTRLGNVIRAGEAEPQYRYKAHAVVLWPLLYHVLPRETINDIADARGTLEFLLVLSLWCSGFAVLNPLTALIFNGSLAIAALLFSAGLLLAYTAYLAAIPAAAEYAAYLRSTFELYRFNLLARLRLPIPKNLKEEVAIWNELCEFVLRGAALESMYDPGVSEQVVRIGGIQSPHG